MYWPRPGSVKICSTMIAPPSRPEICRPSTVTTGNQRVLQAVPERRPCAPSGPWRGRSACSPGAASPSSEDRVRRMTPAAEPSASTAAGGTNCFRLPNGSSAKLDVLADAAGHSPTTRRARSAPSSRPRRRAQQDPRSAISAHAVVGRRVLQDGGDDPERNPDQDGHGQRQNHQLERHREAVLDRLSSRDGC